MGKEKQNSARATYPPALSYRRLVTHHRAPASQTPNATNGNRTNLPKVRYDGSWYPLNGPWRARNKDPAEPAASSAMTPLKGSENGNLVRGKIASKRSFAIPR